MTILCTDCEKEFSENFGEGEANFCPHCGQVLTELPQEYALQGRISTDRGWYDDDHPVMNRPLYEHIAEVAEQAEPQFHYTIDEELNVELHSIEHGGKLYTEHE